MFKENYWWNNIWRGVMQFILFFFRRLILSLLQSYIFELYGVRWMLIYQWSNFRKRRNAICIILLSEMHFTSFLFGQKSMLMCTFFGKLFFCIPHISNLIQFTPFVISSQLTGNVRSRGHKSIFTINIQFYKIGVINLIIEISFDNMNEIMCHIS